MSEAKARSRAVDLEGQVSAVDDRLEDRLPRPPIKGDAVSAARQRHRIAVLRRDDGGGMTLAADADDPVAVHRGAVSGQLAGDARLVLGHPARQGGGDGDDRILGKGWK